MSSPTQQAASAGISTEPLRRSHASSISERVNPTKKKESSYKVSSHPKWIGSFFTDARGKKRPAVVQVPSKKLRSSPWMICCHMFSSPNKFDGVSDVDQMMVIMLGWMEVVYKMMKTRTPTKI